MINNSNGSIKSQPKKKIEDRTPASVIKNKNQHNVNNSNDNLNKYIILPNLYQNNNRSINNNSSSPKKNIIKKKNNGSYKILNNDNNQVNNAKNMKIIDGRNINGNMNNIALKKNNYQINLMSDDYAKMLLDKNSGHKQNNKLNNIYNIGVDERNFLRILQQRKKRMLYIGKV